MLREQLRQRQRPLKESYRNAPSSALAIFRATGTLCPETLICRLPPQADAHDRATIDAGLHAMAGGDGSKACSAEMLLQSLVACAGVTLLAVATALDIPVSGGQVTAEGQLDFRGTLAIDRDTPVGLAAIQLTFSLNSAADRTQLNQLLELTERYCVVLQTLRSAARVEAAIELAADADTPESDA